MENSRFDWLVRAVSEAMSRRGLLRGLAAVPLLGLAAALNGDAADAGRRRRRKARHRRRQNNRQQQRKGKGHNKKRSCNPESPAKTCEGRCGTVKNTCNKKVDCGICCDPVCEICQTCDTSNGQCGPDAAKLGSACGELNEVCRVEGTCAACDVCPSGCDYQTVQEAVNAASNGATIHICAGTFEGTITIGEDLTLIGAGDGSGAGNTILQGNQNGTVVTISAGPTVTLQGLRITSGDTINGGGVSNAGTLTMTGCTVTQNGADQGGGIYNTGALTLNQSSIEGNFATNNEGGGMFNGNGGDLVMNDSQISNNTAGRAGGGLFNDSARATLNNSTISANTATGQNGNPGQGGGIYNEIGTITLNSGSSVSGNNPDNCAGETVEGC